MTDDGVLVSSGAQGSWAWVGARLEPEAALSEHGGFAGLPEERRTAEAAVRERTWLAERWVPDGRHRFEIRYWNEPDTGRVSCALLGQVHDRDRQSAETAARALRPRLLSVPRHVRAVGLDAAGVRHALAPFGAGGGTGIGPGRGAGAGPGAGAGGDSGPGDGGLAEVRKRLAWAPSTRHDARFRVGVMVFPLAGQAVSWEPVWDELARQDRPCVIGVCLEPSAPGEGLPARLGYLAQEYGRLAVAGTPNPVYQQPVPADPFAIRAAPLYQDAARRYGGRVFRMRIAVAAAGPVPLHLAETVAATVSTQPGAGAATAAEAAVVRVPPEGERRTAWHSVSTLGRAWLEETYGQGAPPGRLGPVERVLSDLVDLPEAGTAFRFPYETPGRPPLFDTASRRAAQGGPRGGGPAPAAPQADPHFPGL
ncbi:hypothetical protein ACFYYR_16180 [Streptomyces sp. NPDC001922]|uniref:hypothetical protein n=1 Tax=Streptomyces sp. NPDC001922 TaxID=3364624 RepID=UPI0036BCE0EE